MLQRLAATAPEHLLPELTRHLESGPLRYNDPLQQADVWDGNIVILRSIKRLPADLSLAVTCIHENLSFERAELLDAVLERADRLAAADAIALIRRSVAGLTRSELLRLLSGALPRLAAHHGGQRAIDECIAGVVSSDQWWP